MLGLSWTLDNFAIYLIVHGKFKKKFLNFYTNLREKAWGFWVGYFVRKGIFNFFTEITNFTFEGKNEDF